MRADLLLLGEGDHGGVAQDPLQGVGGSEDGVGDVVQHPAIGGGLPVTIVPSLAPRGEGEGEQGESNAEVHRSPHVCGGMLCNNWIIINK